MNEFWCLIRLAHFWHIWANYLVVHRLKTTWFEALNIGKVRLSFWKFRHLTLLIKLTLAFLMPFIFSLISNLSHSNNLDLTHIILTFCNSLFNGFLLLLLFLFKAFLILIFKSNFSFAYMIGKGLFRQAKHEGES